MVGNRRTDPDGSVSLDTSDQCRCMLLVSFKDGKCQLNKLRIVACLGELMLEWEEEQDVVAVSRCFALHIYLPGKPNFLNDFIRTSRYGKDGKGSTMILKSGIFFMKWAL